MFMNKTITVLVYTVGGIYILLDLFWLLKTIGSVNSGVGGFYGTVLIIGLIFDIILIVGLVSALSRTEDLEEVESLRRLKDSSKVNDLEYDFKDFKCDTNKEIEELKREINSMKKNKK